MWPRPRVAIYHLTAIWGSPSNAAVGTLSVFLLLLSPKGEEGLIDLRQNGSDTQMKNLVPFPFQLLTLTLHDPVTTPQVKPETNRRLSETRDLTGKGEIVVIVGRAAADCIQCDRGFTLPCGYRVFLQICFISFSGFILLLQPVEKNMSAAC